MSVLATDEIERFITLDDTLEGNGKIKYNIPVLSF